MKRTNMKRTYVSLALLFLGTQLSAYSHALESKKSTVDTLTTEEAATSKKFEAEDIFELEYASAPQVSPDGKWVIYTRRSHDVMTDGTRSNLWISRTDGSLHRPLLSGKKA